MTEIFGRLQAALAAFTDRPAQALTPDLHMVDDLGLDSLAKLEATAALEQTFGVPLSDDDAEHMQTVGDACRVIARRLAAPA